jgi:hypothetical protein
MPRGRIKLHPLDINRKEPSHTWIWIVLLGGGGLGAVLVCACTVAVFLVATMLP